MTLGLVAKFDFSANSIPEFWNLYHDGTLLMHYFQLQVTIFSEIWWI